MAESPAESDARPTTGPGSFLTTRWHLVLQATADSTSAGAEAGEALEALCRAYWQPLYTYVRRLGFTPTDAQDLTQAFFARLLERNYLQQADQRRGRFRSFLLGALRHFISDEQDRVRAWKRGGRHVHVPLDPGGVADGLQPELAAAAPPETAFDRAWAQAVMARVQGRLREECTEGPRAGLHAALFPVDPTPGAPATHAEIGARLGMTEGAVKLAAFRLRQRYRDLIREEVAQTLADPAELEDEIRHLLNVLSHG
ncbi:MAG: sigma-70 family RNA polymerase sigma factor [Verrucomicrobiales bacterium]|nr:sigma-70 family RNA polymerase sigma factor [Verrucomicrobiales bacterium]